MTSSSSGARADANYNCPFDDAHDGLTPARRDLTTGIASRAMSDDADDLTGAEPDAPETMRDEMVQNAVAFLQHPQVRS